MATSTSLLATAIRFASWLPRLISLNNFAGLPGDPQALLRWLLAQAHDVLLELLAYCTARSIDAMAARKRTADQSDAIAQALGLDMAHWWVPTAANYLAMSARQRRSRRWPRRPASTARRPWRR